MRVVPIEYALGNELAESVYDTNGNMLIRKGMYLNDSNIIKIKANGVYSVYINDRFSQNKITAPISEHLKNATMVEMYRVFEESRKNKLYGSSNDKDLEKAIEKLLDTAKDIMYELDQSGTTRVNHTDIKSISTYTYAHPIHVAVLSYMLAKGLKFSKEDLENIFLGALFADIGMSFINENLFMKKGKLDVQAFVKIKEHPQLGYDFIKDFYFANTYIKMVVLQHQEKIDGSGYPNNIKDKDIHPFAKLVAIADVYDAMISDRIYARATSSSEAIEYIMGAAGRHFDFDYAKAFVSTIIPYPEGSLVRMNTGQIALVHKTNMSLPLRPKVKLIDSTRKILEKSVVDLTDEKNIVIEQLEYQCP